MSSTVVWALLRTVVYNVYHLLWSEDKASRMHDEPGGQSKEEVGEGCGNTGQVDGMVLCFFPLDEVELLSGLLHIID